MRPKTAALRPRCPKSGGDAFKKFGGRDQGLARAPWQWRVRAGAGVPTGRGLPTTPAILAANRKSTAVADPAGSRWMSKMKPVAEFARHDLHKHPWHMPGQRRSRYWAPRKSGNSWKTWTMMCTRSICTWCDSKFWIAGTLRQRDSRYATARFLRYITGIYWRPDANETGGKGNTVRVERETVPRAFIVPFVGYPGRFTCGICHNPRAGRTTR